MLVAIAVAWGHWGSRDVAYGQGEFERAEFHPQGEAFGSRLERVLWNRAGGTALGSSADPSLSRIYITEFRLLSNIRLHLALSLLSQDDSLKATFRFQPVVQLITGRCCRVPSENTKSGTGMTVGHCRAVEM
jgi:hypothetical protein